MKNEEIKNIIYALEYLKDFTAATEEGQDEKSELFIVLNHDVDQALETLYDMMKAN